MTSQQSALEALEALADQQIAAEAAQLNKVDRPYLGVSNPQIDLLYKEWRKDTDIDQRVVIAEYLWDSNIHEARIAAAKLLTQARINPDIIVWNEIIRWVPDCDTSEISDHACAAGARRLPADLERLDTLELWTTNSSVWVRRASLIMTLPWAKLNHPTAIDLIARDRVLSWAAIYSSDHDPVMQKAIALWLRTLSKHDKQSALGFLDAYGTQMSASALKEASVHLVIN
jgi:3-methyladenine DNA glycosylase AlkD